MTKRPGLRLAWHRGTTAHVASLYPFSVQAPVGADGVCIGVDLLAGAAPFLWDPFDSYSAGLITNPNAWVLGEPGTGKSALVKSLLSRMATQALRTRWLAVMDPKGEYRLLAEHLGMTVVKLTPGGDVRVNPLAPGPAAEHDPADKQVLRRAELVCALIATVLERALDAVRGRGPVQGA